MGPHCRWAAQKEQRGLATMDNPEVMGLAGTAHCTMQDWR